MGYNKNVLYKGILYNLRNKEDIMSLQENLGLQQTGKWGPWQEDFLQKKNKEYYKSSNKDNSKLSYNNTTELYNKTVQPFVEGNVVNTVTQKVNNSANYLVELPKNVNKSQNKHNAVKNNNNTRVFNGITYVINNKEDVIKLQKSINKSLELKHLQEDGIYGADTEQALVDFSNLKNYYYNKKKQLKKGEPLKPARFTQSLKGKIYGTISQNNKGLYQEWDPISKKFKPLSHSEKGAILVDGKLYDADTQASELQKLTGQKQTGKWTNENQAYMENLFSNMSNQQNSSSTIDFYDNKNGYKKIIDDYVNNAHKQNQESRLAQTFNASSSTDASALGIVKAAEDINYDDLGKIITNKIKQDFGIDVSKLNNSDNSNSNTTNYSKQYIQNILNDPINKKYALAISYLENSQKYLASLQQHKDSKFERWLGAIKNNILLGAISNLQNINKNTSQFGQDYKQQLNKLQAQNDAKIGWTVEDEKDAAKIGFAADVIPELIVTVLTGGTGGAISEGLKQVATKVAKQAIKQAVAIKLTKQAAQQFVKNAIHNAALYGSMHTVRGAAIDANNQVQSTGKINIKQAAKAGLKEGVQMAATAGVLSAIPVIKTMTPFMPKSMVTTLKAANIGNTLYLTGMDVKAGYNNIKKGNYWSALSNGFAAGFDLLGGIYLNKGLSTSKNLNIPEEVLYQPISKNTISFSSPKEFMRSVKDRIALNTNFGRSLSTAKDYIKRLSPKYIKQLYSDSVASGTINTLANITGATMYTANALLAPLGKYYLGKTIYNQGFDRDTGDWSISNVVGNTFSDYFSFDPDRLNNARMITMPISGKFNLNNHRLLYNANNNIRNNFHVANTMYNTANRYRNLAFSTSAALPMTENALNNFSDHPFESLGELYMAWNPSIQGIHNYIQGVGKRLEAVSGGTETPDAAKGSASKLTRNILKIRQTEEKVNSAFNELSPDDNVDSTVIRLLTYNNANNSTKKQYDKEFSDRAKKILKDQNEKEIGREYVYNTLINLRKEGKNKQLQQELQNLLDETQTIKEIEKELQELSITEGADPQRIQDLQNILYKYRIYQGLIDLGYIKVKYDKNSNQWVVSSIEDPTSHSTGSLVYKSNANTWDYSNNKQITNRVRSLWYLLTGSNNTKDFFTNLQDTTLPFFYSESYKLSNSMKNNRIFGNQINYNTKQGDFAYNRDPSIAAPGSYLDDHKKYYKVSERLIGDNKHSNDLEEIADAYYGIDFYTDRNTRGSKQNFVDANNSLQLLSSNKQNAKIYNPETRKYEPLYVNGKINPVIKKCAFASHYDIGLQGRRPTQAAKKSFANEDILNTGGINTFIVELGGRRYAMVMDVDGPGSSRRGVDTRLASSPLKHTGSQNVAFELVPLTEESGKQLLTKEPFRDFDQSSKSTKYSDAPANVSEARYIIETSTPFEKQIRNERKQKASDYINKLKKCTTNKEKKELKNELKEEYNKIKSKIQDEIYTILCEKFPEHDKLWEKVVQKKTLSQSQKDILESFKNSEEFKSIINYFNRLSWSTYIDVVYDPNIKKYTVITYGDPKNYPTLNSQRTDDSKMLEDSEQHKLPQFSTYHDPLNKMFLNIITRKVGGKLLHRRNIKYFR